MPATCLVLIWLEELLDDSAVQGTDTSFHELHAA